MSKAIEEAMHQLEPVYTELSRAVIGAAIEVHKTLGPGLLEGVYEEALAVEMQLRSVRFNRQVPVPPKYKGVPIGDGRLDFMVADRLVVELKSVEVLAAIHTAQTLGYLKAADFKLGLLINFNVPLLMDGVKRLINTIKKN